MTVYFSSVLNPEGATYVTAAHNIDRMKLPKIGSAWSCSMALLALLSLSVGRRRWHGTGGRSSTHAVCVSSWRLAHPTSFGDNTKQNRKCIHGDCAMWSNVSIQDVECAELHASVWSILQHVRRLHASYRHRSRGYILKFLVYQLSSDIRTLHYSEQGDDEALRLAPSSFEAR